MSFAAISEAIRERFREQIAVPQSLLVVHSNEPPRAVQKRWCQLSVEIQNTQQVSTGSPTSRRFRVTGRIALNLFERIGAGDGQMLDLMDAMTTAFRGVSLSSPQVTFSAPTPIGLSVKDEAGGHWRMPAQIPFRADVVGSE